MLRSERVLATTYTSLGASARCHLSAGVLTVRYRGAVGLESMGALSVQMAARGSNAGASVAFYDRALVAFDWASAHNSRVFTPRSSVAGAIVVLPEQLEAATFYCAQLAKRAVYRMAFTAGEEPLARQWALAAAGLASAGLCNRESIRA